MGFLRIIVKQYCKIVEPKNRNRFLSFQIHAYTPGGKTNERKDNNITHSIYPYLLNMKRTQTICELSIEFHYFIDNCIRYALCLQNTFFIL